MQAIKNGIKCTLRTPGKTLLFVLILTIIAALLAVSFSVFFAVRGYLDDCEDYFHTIAELEYVGRDYPDPFVYDEAVGAAAEENAALLNELLSSDAAISFEPASACVAVSGEMHRWDNNVYDPDAAVIKVHVMSYDTNLDLYNVLVSESLYSRKDYTNRLLMVSGDKDEGLSLVSGCDYVIVGRFFKGNTSNPWFSQQPLSYEENGETVIVDKPIPAEELGENSVYERLAYELHMRNDSVRVTYTSSIEDLYPFHQQILQLKSGRFFTEEEYENRAAVCIVSERIAGLLGAKVGDTIDFDVFGADGDIYASSTLRRVDSRRYEIVGIQTDSDSFPYRVFMPDKGAADAGISQVNGYTLGQFRLKNSRASAFLEEAEPLTERGFRVNVYDQGYAAATEPIRELLLISGIFLAVCLLLAVCALALQSHLFISRQRETALTMFDLGSGKAHVYVYFLAAALALTFIAAVAGCFAGKLLENRVFGILKDYASQFKDMDTRFSSSSIALTRTLEFSPKSSLAPYLAAALLLIAGSLIFTLAFSAGALQNKAARTKKKRAAKKRAVVNRAAHTSHLSGFFKYSLLSMRRGLVRTLAVVLMGLVAAVFFGRLTASADGYRTQLDAYRASARITGYATDLEGHRMNGLVLKQKPIVKLYMTDMVDDCCVTTNLGHIAFIYQVGETYVEHKPPQSSYAYETMFDKVYKSSAWTGVSSVRNSPLFHYSKSGEVEWLEGYSDKDFTQSEVKTFTNYYWDFKLDEAVEEEAEYRTGEPICAISRNMMEEYGISLGDELQAIVAYYYQGNAILSYEELKVAAVYTSSTMSTEVFSPSTYVPKDLAFEAMEELAESEDGDWSAGTVFFCGTRVTVEEYEAMLEMGVFPGRSYSSFTFRLKDNDRLDELRDTLIESGWTFIRSGNRAHSPVIVEDEMFLSTTQSMQRQIQYITVLYSALYIMAGVIGFVLAWLMTMSRRKEIAVQRALGTPPIRIALNFFFEQALLILIGLALGVGVSKLTGADPTKLSLTLCAAFFGVWSVSALICLITSLVKRSYAALTEPE